MNEEVALFPYDKNWPSMYQMDLPPPHSVEPLSDRQVLLDELVKEIRHFLKG